MNLATCTKANRERWDELTPIHAQSRHYDLEGFRAGNSSLRSVEREELGDVRGKSLLHLQCHFGLDTLSWARQGASVTGVDFSPEAIALARWLTCEQQLEASFICSEIYQLPSALGDQFDIVFTSYGVLLWLSDLTRWAEVVSHFLKPGGTFYMVETHPLLPTLEVDEASGELQIAGPYFHSPEPRQCEWPGTYTESTAEVRHASYFAWHHSLSEVLSALAAAGLRIEFVHEFPYVHLRFLANMEQAEDGWWRLKKGSDHVPLLYSVKATKDRG